MMRARRSTSLKNIPMSTPALAPKEPPAFVRERIRHRFVLPAHKLWPLGKPFFRLS
jgi:hypothetical protein